MANDTALANSSYGFIQGGIPQNAYDWQDCTALVSGLKNSVSTSESHHAIVAAPAAGKTLYLWGWAAATAGNATDSNLTGGLRNTGESVNKIHFQAGLQGPQLVRLAMPVEFPAGITLELSRSHSSNNWLSIFYTDS